MALKGLKEVLFKRINRMSTFTKVSVKRLIEETMREYGNDRFELLKIVEEEELRAEYDELLELMSSLTGVSADFIDKEQYHFPYTYYRGMIANVLTNRGYTGRQVARVMHRHHSTIQKNLEYLKKNRKNPAMREIYELKDKFHELVNSREYRKRHTKKREGLCHPLQPSGKASWNKSGQRRKNNGDKSNEG